MLFFYSVDESSLFRLDPNEEVKLGEQDSVILNSNFASPKTKTEKANMLMLIPSLKKTEIDEICLQ